MRRERRLARRLAAWGAAAVLGASLVVGCGPDDAEPATGTSPPSTTSTSVRPTDGFHVSGERIIGPDGEPFVARGVNLLGPQSFWPAETAGLSDAVLDWGLNAVRINTCLPGGCQDAGAVWDLNDDLDAIVEEFTGAGLVVIIALHQVEPGSYPDDATFAAVSQFWQSTAQRYADNPLVWFNLLNEPGHGDVDVRWRTVHGRLIDVVREHAPNLILVDGTQYGQEAGLPPGTEPVTEATSAILRYGPALAARAPDIAFSVHVYDQWGEPADEDARFERLSDFLTAVREEDLAVLMGETGAPADDPDGIRGRATHTAYQVAAALDVGVLAWHGQAHDGFDLLRRADGSPADLDLTTAEPTWHGDLLLALTRPEDG